MKKLLIVFVLFSLICLVSCESFYSYSSNSGTSSSNKNEYYARSYSSNYGKITFSKTDIFLIEVASSDFSFSRPFELEIQKCLERKGIKAYMMTDFDVWDENGEIKSDKFFDMYETVDPDYIICIYFDDMYTYETGGGISRIKVDSEVEDWKNFSSDISVSITTTVDGKNNFEKYYSSVETISKEVSRSIVEELYKYF